MADSLLQKICVRTHLLIDHEQLNWGSGFIVKNEAFYVITAYHCISLEGSDNIKKEHIRVETQKGDYKSKNFHEITVLEIVNSNEDQDWALLKIEDPGIDDVDFSKIITAIPHKDDIVVRLCGYPKNYVEEFRPFKAEIITRSTNDIKISLLEKTFQIAGEDGSRSAKGLSGSAVGIQVDHTLYVFGICLSVIGENASFDDVNCRSIVCLPDIIGETAVLTNAIVESEHAANQRKLPNEKSEDKIRILHIFEKEPVQLTQNIDKALRSIYNLQSEGKTEVYTYNDILIEGEDFSALQYFDSVAIFSNQSFGTTWTSIDQEFKDKMKELCVGIVFCSGDLLATIASVKENGININAELVVPQGFSIEFFWNAQKDIQEVLNVIGVKGIEYLNTKKGNESKELYKTVFRERFVELNFDAQEEPLLLKNFEKFNLCIIEGTPLCAHELLIKRIFNIVVPQIDIEQSHYYPIKIQNYKKDEFTKGHLWGAFIGHISQGDLSQAHDNEAVLSTLVDHIVLPKLASKDIVSIIECDSDEASFHKIIEEFWSDLTKMFKNKSPRNRLFVFALNKNYKKGECSWQSSDVIGQDNCSSSVLDPITPLDQGIFRKWYINLAGLRDYELYKNLQASPEKILGDKTHAYMEEVIRNTCRHFNLPSDFANEIITIDSRNNG